MSTLMQWRSATLLMVALVLVPREAGAVARAWTGNNRDWNNANAWTPAAIPTAADDLTVANDAGRVNQMRIRQANASARTLSFGAGANAVTLNCNGGTTLTIAGNGGAGLTFAATTGTIGCPLFLSNGQLSVGGSAAEVLTLGGALTTGALTKSGDGTVNLTGGGTIGSIAVTAGTVFLGTTLTGTTATVAAGATLGGTGGVGGAVSVSGGTLDPGTVAGTGALATGALTMSAGSTLNFNFSGATTVTRINVTGTATVAGTLNITGAVPTDGTYILVSATGPVTDAGLQLGAMPAGKAFGVRAAGNTLVLDVATVPIRIDASSTAQNSCNGNLTWAHTVGDGNDRYLVVGVSTSSTAGLSPTGVTFAGTPLTLLESDPGGTTRVFVYGLVAPTPRTGNVVVTLPVATACGAVAGAMSFTGVSQTGPVGNTTTSVGTGITATANLTLTQGDRAVSVLAATNVATVTPQPGAALRYRVAQSPALGGATTMDRRTAGSGNTDLTWTLPSSQPWSLSVVALHAAAPSRDSSASAVVRATDRGSVLSWRAGPGLDVVGYRVWREAGSRTTLLTPGLVEGPVLQSRARALAGRAYDWEDLRPVAGARYWLESLHADGSTTREPAAAVAGKVTAPSASVALVGDRSILGPAPEFRRGPLQTPRSLQAAMDRSSQWRLAGAAAAKLGVRSEGVHRVSAEALFGAGIPVGAAVGMLQLFRDGRQIPMEVQAADGAHLQPGDAVEFYGIGADTRYTDTAVYWLVSGQGSSQGFASAGAPVPAVGTASYLEARELRERLVWFGAARNGDAEKFFGDAVFSTSASHAFAVDALDPASDGAFLEVALQGVTEVPHAVSVTVNGLGVGSVLFDGATLGTASFPLPPGLLVEGEAQVSLSSASGSDVSLEDHLRLVYPRRTARGTGALVFSLPGGSTTRVSGFLASSARVLDVTDPAEPVRLAVVDDGTGAASVQAPGSGPRRLLAYLAEDRIQPASITSNVPSALHAETAGADLIVVGPADLLAALGPLMERRRAEGLTVLSVDVEDVLDEYSFGVRSAQALRDYLQQATAQWTRRPRFVLLAGLATYDPRDYLGLGGDRVSSGTVQTDFLEVASDHWFVDFPGGSAVAVGRLPVRTANEATVLVSKILGHQTAGPDAPVLLVADQVGTSDFPGHLQAVASKLPAAPLQWIVRGTDTDAALHDQLLGRLRQGPAVVDYAGHGAETFWAGNLHDVDDAVQLAGTGKTSLYVHVTCLAGFFQDPRRQSLAVSTLLTPGGGAWGAWASTGMSYPADHPALNAALVDALLNQGQTLGEATRAALAATDDPTVQNTLVLLGDPSARLAPVHRPALTVPDPSPKATGCGAVDGPVGLLPLLLAAAWLLRRRPA